MTALASASLVRTGLALAVAAAAERGCCAPEISCERASLAWMGRARLAPAGLAAGFAGELAAALRNICVNGEPATFEADAPPPPAFTGESNDRSTMLAVLLLSVDERAALGRPASPLLPWSMATLPGAAGPRMASRLSSTSGLSSTLTLMPRSERACAEVAWSMVSGFGMSSRVSKSVCCHTCSVWSS
jgi:hypothetical protein